MKYDLSGKKLLILNRLRYIEKRISRWWWWLWTGKPSRKEMRRRLQEEARRFGGKIIWDRRNK
jgi:hypothetical protein